MYLSSAEVTRYATQICVRLECTIQFTFEWNNHHSEQKNLKNIKISVHDFSAFFCRWQTLLHTRTNIIVTFKNIMKLHWSQADRQICWKFYHCVLPILLILLVLPLHYSVHRCTALHTPQTSCARNFYHLWFCYVAAPFRPLTRDLLLLTGLYTIHIGRMRPRPEKLSVCGCQEDRFSTHCWTIVLASQFAIAHATTMYRLQLWSLMRLCKCSP